MQSINLLSAFIPCDPEFIEQNFREINESTYGFVRTDYHIVVSPSQHFAWVPANWCLNYSSEIVGGLLVGSIWDVVDCCTEYVGYLDISANSRQFVVLHTQTGSLPSSTVEVNDAGTQVLMGWGKIKKDIIFDVESRSLQITERCDET